MARRAPSRVVRSNPRTMIWFGARIARVGLSASASTLVGTFNAAALALRPFTIVRTRLLIGFASDQFSAAENPEGVLSMGIVKDTATAIGITAVPTPITEVDNDFFVYQAC